jgi:ribosomal protein S21
MRQKGGDHMRIEARDGESFEQTLRRFTRSVNNSGILREFRASQRRKQAAKLNS